MELSAPNFKKHGNIVLENMSACSLWEWHYLATILRFSKSLLLLWLWPVGEIDGWKPYESGSAMHERVLWGWWLVRVQGWRVVGVGAVTDLDRCHAQLNSLHGSVNRSFQTVAQDPRGEPQVKGWVH